jgi:L-alanine-DL-glutamate epimerase-like enolase superfamily enzyme
MENGGGSIVMPDVVWAGGISETRKIAQYAETY